MSHCLAIALLLAAHSVRWSEALLTPPNPDHNHTDTAIISLGLAELTRAIPTSTLVIFEPPADTEQLFLPLNRFLQDAHAAGIRTCTFTEADAYFDYLHDCHDRSEQTTTLIVAPPATFLAELQSRNLVHRAHLFMFYWNASRTHCATKHNNVSLLGGRHHRRLLAALSDLPEAVRVVLIFRRPPHCLCVFYNRAASDGRGNFAFVNHYDADDVGVRNVPLLPAPSRVYRNFRGRTLRVPVIHSPPWHFVEYTNESGTQGTNTTAPLSSNPASSSSSAPGSATTNAASSAISLRVIGGRDFHLLRLLAKYMNFSVAYADPAERTQGTTVYETGEPDATALGSPTSTDATNATFSGGLGMLQRREADLLLGDVTVTWERRQTAAEFSFFTLADSAAFATHAPRRLSEAWILVRPFRWEVWPLLVGTILISAPAFWVIIGAPFWWRRRLSRSQSLARPRPRSASLPVRWDPRFQYIAEMQYGIRDVVGFERGLRQRARWLARGGRNGQRRRGEERIPRNLLMKCIWFTIALFLKQSCDELYPGKRAKFLTTILWLATTYVLADVYSAQLTSQLARPAREAPINTLVKLEAAMKTSGYQLFVERESSSFSTLENGTEIFKRLYNLMAGQKSDALSSSGNDSALVASVEEGVSLILGGARKVILGGRETLYFNLKRHGVQNFQLSEKLYTRYSAVAVQIGCPFIESLNAVLIHLFEGGILEKMTNAEYEQMINHSKNQTSHDTVKARDDPKIGDTNKVPIESKMKPINLRALQGAFIALSVGCALAAIVLGLERNWPRVERGAARIALSVVRWRRNGRQTAARAGRRLRRAIGDFMARECLW